MGRGSLSRKCSDKSKEVLGREITLTELRLMPYIQYTMMNEQKLDPRKINQDEREVLSLWKKEGHIEGGITGLRITKNFWDAINEILWISYVECADE
jgi:hypothetical protein